MPISSMACLPRFGCQAKCVSQLVQFTCSQWSLPPMRIPVSSPCCNRPTPERVGNLLHRGGQPPRCLLPLPPATLPPPAPTRPPPLPLPSARVCPPCRRSRPPAGLLAVSSVSSPFAPSPLSPRPPPALVAVLAQLPHHRRHPPPPLLRHCHRKAALLSFPRPYSVQ